MSDDVQKRLEEVSVGGKITCAQAEMVAKEFDMSRKAIGEIINELELKITSCQLGCF